MTRQAISLQMQSIEYTISMVAPGIVPPLVQSISAFLSACPILLFPPSLVYPAYYYYYYYNIYILYSTQWPYSQTL
jgi:hypothetical protein